MSYQKLHATHCVLPEIMTKRFRGPRLASPRSRYGAKSSKQKHSIALWSEILLVADGCETQSRTAAAHSSAVLAWKQDSGQAIRICSSLMTIRGGRLLKITKEVSSKKTHRKVLERFISHLANRQKQALLPCELFLSNKFTPAKIVSGAPLQVTSRKLSVLLSLTVFSYSADSHAGKHWTYRDKGAKSISADTTPTGIATLPILVETHHVCSLKSLDFWPLRFIVWHVASRCVWVRAEVFVTENHLLDAVKPNLCLCVMN